MDLEKSKTISEKIENGEYGSSEDSLKNKTPIENNVSKESLLKKEIREDLVIFYLTRHNKFKILYILFHHTKLQFNLFRLNLLFDFFKIHGSNKDLFWIENHF